MAERELHIKATMNATSAVKGSKQTTDAVKKVKGETDKASKSSARFSDVIANSSTGVAAFEGPLGKTAGRLSTFATITRRAETALDSKTKSLGRFKVALAATGIGAIIVLLGTLIQAFRSTQEGSDRLNRVLVPLKAIFSALWGVIQNVSLLMADKLVDAFNDPQQAIKDMGNAILQNIINRFKAVVDLGGAVGKILRGLGTMDFNLLRQGASDAGNAFIQMNTGIEDSTGKLSRFAQGIAEASREAFESGKRIQELNEQIEQMRIDQEVPLARLNREYRELINVARDTNKTEEERLDAIDRALAARRQITAEEQKLLDLEIQRMELNQSLNDTSREEQLELQKLLARREELVASTEQELGRRLSMRNAIIQSMEDEKRKEEELEKQRLEAMEKQAQAYLDMLLSDEEMAQKRFEKELSMLQELHSEGIISYTEFTKVRERLEKDFIQNQETRVGSIMELEEQLARAKIEYRQAVSDEDREQHKENIKRLEDELEQIKRTRMDATQEIIAFTQQSFAVMSDMFQTLSERRLRDINDEKNAVLDRIDAQLAGDRLSEAQRIKLLEEREKVETEIEKRIADEKRRQFKLDKIARIAEIAMNTAVAVSRVWGQTGIFGAGAQVPVLIMGAAQTAIAAAQPNPYLLGGLVDGAIGQSGMTSPGQKLISINEDRRPEYIVNAESTRRALPILEAINRDPGYADLLMSGMQNMFLEGGPVSRPRRRTGADVPALNRTGESIASAIREGMRGVVVDAQISVEEMERPSKRFQEFQKSIGN